MNGKVLDVANKSVLIGFVLFLHRNIAYSQYPQSRNTVSSSVNLSPFTLPTHRNMHAPHNPANSVWFHSYSSSLFLGEKLEQLDLQKKSAEA